MEENITKNYNYINQFSVL